MAGSRAQFYTSELLSLPAMAWAAYLGAESALPGPRANLELLHAAADLGSREQFEAWLHQSPPDASGDEPGIMPVMVALVGLGRLAAAGEREHLPALRAYANDHRWRVREAVAMALQRIGAADGGLFVRVAADWSLGTLLERRAAVAGLCEPALIADASIAAQALALLDDITASLLEEQDRKGDAFRVLRQSLGYGWSIALAASWPTGCLLFERWVICKDADIAWVVRQNLAKKRLARLDPAWVMRLRASLSAVQSASRSRQRPTACRAS